MEVTLELPDELVRKVRALNILIGGSEDINGLLVKMVDDAIVDKIVSTITEGRVRAAIAKAPARIAQVLPAIDDSTQFQDLTGVSDGLGDPEPARAARRRQSPPAEATVATVASDEELAHDMEVEDPGSEAKVEAPTFADQMTEEGLAPTAEEAFSMASGFQPPVHTPEPSSPRRRRATIDKKRVSAFTGAEQHRL